MITANGALTIVGINTPNVQIFWNGLQVPNIESVRIDWEQDEQRIKLKVTGPDDSIYTEMVASGISIKRG